MSALRQALDDQNPDPEQWEAYEHEGHCAVLAPPGQRQDEIADDQGGLAGQQRAVPKPGPACVTLTNAAANELRTPIRARRQPVGHRQCRHGPLLRHVAHHPTVRRRGRTPRVGRLHAGARQVALAAMTQAINRTFPVGADSRTWTRPSAATGTCPDRGGVAGCWPVHPRCGKRVRTAAAAAKPHRLRRGRALAVDLSSNSRSCRPC